MEQARGFRHTQVRCSAGGWGALKATAQAVRHE